MTSYLTDSECKKCRKPAFLAVRPSFDAMFILRVSELTYNTFNDLKPQGFHHSTCERRKALKGGRKKVEQLWPFELVFFGK